MKFAHVADCHLGSWRVPKLRELNQRSFKYVIDKCIEECVDFLLIAGDFFNTSFPSIDTLHFAVKELMRLNNNGIKIYVIPGSHDFSPSGKSILDVLSNTGLFINIMHGAEIVSNNINLKFIIDKKTGAKITGIYGRRGGLDHQLYKLINSEELSKDAGYKIFMFHCTLTEIKTKELKYSGSVPVSYFPKNFSYYAGGHVHIRKNATIDNYENIVYPGPVFPNSFSEIEKLEYGSFVIVEDNIPEIRKIKIRNVVKCSIDVTSCNADACIKLINQSFENSQIEDSIILIRLSGTLLPSTIIPWNNIIENLENQGAYVVLRNTSALNIKELDDIRVKKGSTKDIENSVVQETIGQTDWMKKNREESIIKSLIQSLSTVLQDGEKSYDFEKRIIETTKNILNFEEKSGDTTLNNNNSI